MMRTASLRHQLRRLCPPLLGVSRQHEVGVAFVSVGLYCDDLDVLPVFTADYFVDGWF
jgi:hypothetical protein